MSGFTWNDGITPGVSFGYDEASRVVEIDNANAHVSRSYFNDDLLRTETQDLTPIGGVSRTITYGYDDDANRGTLQIPGYTFDYTYTGRNQIKSIKNGATTLATYNYDENNYLGDLTSRVLNNGTRTDYLYDPLDRVTWITHTLNGATRGFNYGYQDNTNNRKYVTRTGALGNLGDVFNYDLADQVIGVQLNVQTPQSTPTPTPNISYDPNGNRTTFRPYGSYETYATNNLSAYTSRTILRTTTNAAYDNKGNLTTGFDGSTYVYDAQNRLTSATKSGVNMSFTYDGLNRQVSRTVGGSAEYSTWDGWDLVEEYHGNGVADARYLYGPTGLVKNLTSGNYYYQDGSGSTSHLASSSGTLLEWYRYDLQGTPIFYDASNNQRNPNQSAFSVRHLFTGQQWYSEIGLYDLRNRFYSPDIGRFLQPDPVGFDGDGTNLYRYAGNNPVTYGDPSGERAIYKAAGGYWYYTVNPGWENLRYTSIGAHGWCAEGAQILAGGYSHGTYHDMPNTSYWRQGAPVTSATERDIVVARGWVNRQYGGALMSPGDYVQAYGEPVYHTGIFIASFNGEAFILEQSAGQVLDVHSYSLDRLRQEGWSVVTVPGSNDPYAAGTSTDPNARGGSDAPALSDDERAKINGLLGLASRFNGYWGFLPTTITTNFAGGRAALPGGGSPWSTAGSRLYGGGSIQGSIFGPGNFYSGLDPVAAFGFGASSAGANHANGVP
jgi:RHS repeat-associated protein